MNKGSECTARPTLNRAQVERLLGIKRTKFYELLKRSEFPQAIDLGGTSRVWFFSEVLCWLSKQPRRAVGSEPESLANARCFRNDRQSSTCKPSRIGDAQ